MDGGAETCANGATRQYAQLEYERPQLNDERRAELCAVGATRGKSQPGYEERCAKRGA
jgi:hypothetical protein